MTAREVHVRRLSEALKCMCHGVSSSFARAISNDTRTTYARVLRAQAQFRNELERVQASAPGQANFGKFLLLHRRLLKLYQDLLYMLHQFNMIHGEPKFFGKQNMAALFCRRTIRTPLEFLRSRPEGAKYLPSFLTICYGAVGSLLHYDNDPVWMEPLAGLAQHRMQITSFNSTSRVHWTMESLKWYTEAANARPNAGNLQYHLGILFRWFLLDASFHQCKAQVTIIPYAKSAEAFQALVTSATEEQIITREHNLPNEVNFVKALGSLFNRDPIETFAVHWQRFITGFNDYIDRCGPIFVTKGPQMALCLLTALLDFGKKDSRIWRGIAPWPVPVSVNEENNPTYDHLPAAGNLFRDAIDIVTSRPLDPFTTPFMYVIVTGLYRLQARPEAYELVMPYIPWELLHRCAEELQHHITNDPIRFKVLHEDRMFRGFAIYGDYFPPHYWDHPTHNDNAVAHLVRAERCTNLARSILNRARATSEFNT